MLRLMSCERNWTGFACLESITMNQCGPVVSKEERKSRTKDQSMHHTDEFAWVAGYVFFGSAFQQGFVTSRHYTFWGNLPLNIAMVSL